MNLVLRLATFICAVLLPAAASPQPARAERIVFEYVPPTHPAHKPLYDLLKERQVLEGVREILAPVRWPHTLRLETRSCDGVPNAWYGDATITLCYELLDEMWRSANSAKRPPAIAREDAFIGQFLAVLIHETSHALFDLLKIPVLGHEEAAADQLAAYYMLQFPIDRKRRLILGAAYAHASELKVRRARDLYRPRLRVERLVSFAREHGTAAQRLYNLLCVAYGSDKQLFADVVEQGFLPPERAEICEHEYQQVDFAYRMLIAPHVDSGQ